MSEKIHIVYCSDENYLMPTFVSAASAILHAKEHPVIIHLIEDRVSDDKWEKFRCDLITLGRGCEVVRHHWSDSRFDRCPAWHGSRVIYSRLSIQDFLRDIDWAISVDGDTLWLGDPWELLKLRDAGLLYQISVDPPDPNGRPNPNLSWYDKHGLTMDPKQYYCVGCMLMNLKALRECNFSQQALDFLQKYPDPKYPEQMVMCYLTQGRSAPLPTNWGVYSFYHNDVDISRPCLVHYVQDAPWQRKKIVNLVSDISLVWHRFVTDNALPVGPIRFAGCRNWLDYIWRRGLYLILKHNQWVFKFLPQLAPYFRNTKGL